jgi:hypothetical protein
MDPLHGYGHKPTGYQPEKHLHKKSAKRPRKHQGLKQGTGGRSPRTMTQPIAHERVHKGMALVKALEGMSNRKHSHDGSK